MSRNYESDLIKFNTMYGLPVNTVPTFLSVDRLRNLKKQLIDEVNELDDIITKAEVYVAAVASGDTWGALKLDVLADLTDFLCDVQVYAGAEMIKWGLPMREALCVIMDSNFSKLGADGRPIVNEFGKVEKGPNYGKPEPRLRELLAGILGRKAKQS